MPKNFHFKKGFSSETIITQLNKGRKIEGNQVTYTGFHFDEWFTVLISALHKSETVNDIQFRAAAREALFNPALPINFSENKMIHECNKALLNLLRRKKKGYSVCFQILNISDFPYKELSVNDTKILFNARSRMKFRKIARKERIRLHNDSGKQRKIPELENHSEIIVDVDANNPAEAHQIAKFSIDIVRGTLNLLVNLSKHMRMSSGQRKPVNEILEFPFTTVHDKDGSLAYEGFWYTPNWTQPSHNANFKKYYQHALSNFQTVNEFIKRHRLKSEAHAAMVQYCNALDEPDWQASFLKIWTLLEFLTHIDNAEYDKLVKRASKIFDSIDQNREILKHLRVRRNQIVHENSPEDDLEILIYQSKRIAESLLLLFIKNSFNFDRLDEFAQFLDSPIELSERKKAERILKAANHFWRDIP